MTDAERIAELKESLAQAKWEVDVLGDRCERFVKMLDDLERQNAALREALAQARILMPRGSAKRVSWFDDTFNLLNQTSDDAALSGPSPETVFVPSVWPAPEEKKP